MQMTWLGRRAFLVCAVLVLVSGSAGVNARESTREAPEQEENRPIVKVLSPGAVIGSSDPAYGGAAFLIGNWAGTRVLIALEIIDATGAGINMTDAGEPRFFAGNRNVELFVSHIEATGTYIDGQGRPVIQVISKVPIENLKTGDSLLSPPMDQKSIPPEAREKGFAVPMQAYVEAIDFTFIVQDHNGVKSDPKLLVIAYADDYYRGPFDLVNDPAESAGEEQK